MSNVRVTIDEEEYNFLKECKKIREDNLMELQITHYYKPVNYWDRGRSFSTGVCLFNSKDELMQSSIDNAISNVSSDYKEEILNLKNKIKEYENKNIFERLFTL